MNVHKLNESKLRAYFIFKKRPSRTGWGVAPGLGGCRKGRGNLQNKTKLCSFSCPWEWTAPGAGICYIWLTSGNERSSSYPLLVINLIFGCILLFYFSYSLGFFWGGAFYMMMCMNSFPLWMLPWESTCKIGSGDRNTLAKYILAALPLISDLTVNQLQGPVGCNLFTLAFDSWSILFCGTQPLVSNLFWVEQLNCFTCAYNCRIMLS